MAKRVATIWRAACLGCAVSCASNAGFAIERDAASQPDPAKTNECLAGPKATTPQGERWYYRIERGTKRHCWYTRRETARTIAARTPAPDPVETPDDAAPAPLQPAVANARAEATAPAFPPASQFTSPDKMTAMNTTDAPTRTLAERFSDHPGAEQALQSLPAGMSPPRAATKQLPADGQGSSLWMLLSIIGGVLALVGAAIAIMTQFARRRIRPQAHDHWSATRWHDDQTETSPPLSRNDDEPSTQWDEPPMNWVRIARENVERRADEIEHVMSRPVQPHRTG